MAEWGYNQENGPHYWGKWYPVAEEGTRQSPIDICVDSCEDDSSLPPLLPKFEALADLSLENTGFSWKLGYTPEKSRLTGGPLKGEYRLEQMHAHWGKEEGRGSEHTIDGKMYDGELHLVHYNTAYGSFSEAVDKPDGLAVLGIFLQVGMDFHSELAKITDLLYRIKKKGDKVLVPEKLDPAALLPACDCFFTYPGSLTTPPLFESVTWLVYDKPITITKDQMESMRGLLSGTAEESGCVVDNYRPVCCQRSRVVSKCRA